MIFRSKSLDIKLTSEFGGEHLKFIFKGYFKSEDAKRGAQAWASLFENTSDQYNLIWDCLKMDGYDAESRKIWYDMLQEYKLKILHVKVLSTSFLIRGVAKVMLGFFGIPSQMAQSNEELFVRVNEE